MIVTTVFASIAVLGPEWDALFDAGPGLQSRRAWFEATEEAALPKGVKPHIVAVRDRGKPYALLPMQLRRAENIVSLTSPYTVLFQPLLAPGADPRRAGVVLGRHLRRFPITRLEALDPSWPELAPMLSGFRRAGLAVRRFDHFGNWHEDVSRLDWPAYLAARPGALRETIRRRGRAAAKDPTIHYQVVRGTEGLDKAIAAYETVYARSWKVPEPFPHFNAALVWRLAKMGALSMGVMWQGETPLAAQYWTVVNGEATVLKLAHDDEAKALSPGTLLTAHMIRTLMESGEVRTLDFGRGDDGYKRLWTGERTQRIGVMLANPWRPAGFAELARHWAGQIRRNIRSLKPVDDSTPHA